MPSSPRFRSSSFEPIGQIVQRGLLRYFETTCPSRHDIHIRVEASDTNENNGAESDDTATSCHLRILLPGLPAQHAQFEVHHAGGNVCDVVGGLHGQPARHFSVCFSPGADEADLDEVGEFLLAQIQRRLGTRILRRLSTSDEAATRVLNALWDDDREDRF
jgi:hypothetical protein